jgi:hypothetical protein
MTSKFILKKLLLPLGLASIISLFLAYYSHTIENSSLETFFINLATTFIGILLTFIYVDKTIQKHKKEQWAKVKTKIFKRMEQIANYIILSYRITFNFSVDIFNSEEITNNTREEIIRVTRDVLIPAIDQKIIFFNENNWRKLIENTQLIRQLIDENIKLFGGKINPNILNILLEIEDEILLMTSSYNTFFDIYGVPEDKLPISKKITGIKLKEQLNKIASGHIRELLLLSINLLKEIDKGK